MDGERCGGERGGRGGGSFVSGDETRACALRAVTDQLALRRGTSRDVRVGNKISFVMSCQSCDQRKRLHTHRRSTPRPLDECVNTHLRLRSLVAFDKMPRERDTRAVGCRQNVKLHVFLYPGRPESTIRVGSRMQIANTPT